MEQLVGREMKGLGEDKTGIAKEGTGHAEEVSQLNVAGLSAATSGARTEEGLFKAAPQVGDRLTITGNGFPVAVAQITTDPGKISANTEKIIQKIKEARALGATLVVFPEVTIPGYCSMDLFFNKNYIADNLAALQEVRKATEGIAVAVGFVDVDLAMKRPGGRPMLYNSVAVIQNGEIVRVIDKSLLPNYDIFFEQVHFARARENKVVEIAGKKVGIQVCEDIWNDGYESNPTAELIAQGAEVIVNLSASPFHIGKVPVRSDLLSNTARKNHVPIVYANLVGGFDGYEGEVVFDGRSTVMSSEGNIIQMAKGFTEDLMVADVFSSQKMALPKIDPVEELHDALVLGIKDYDRRIGGASRFKYAIIGLSGGIDSALVAALAVKALGPDRVLGVTLPSKYSSDPTKGDAALSAKNLGIRFKSFSIEESCAATLNELRKDPDFAAGPEGVTEENVQPRDRMTFLMALGNKLGGYVLNTGNKTELALDNMTIYGDMVGGVGVIADVDKDRVYDLCEYINRQAGKEIIPQTTIDRTPSAELKPNQTDAMVMGGEPRILAPMVRAIVEENLCLTDAVERFEGKFNKKLIEDVYRKLDRSEWKRRQASPGIRVTPHAFGNGRKVPISHGYYK